MGGMSETTCNVRGARQEVPARTYVGERGREKGGVS